LNGWENVGKPEKRQGEKKRENVGGENWRGGKPEGHPLNLPIKKKKGKNFEKERDLNKKSPARVKKRFAPQKWKRRKRQNPPVKKQNKRKGGEGGGGGREGAALGIVVGHVRFDLR